MNWIDMKLREIQETSDKMRSGEIKVDTYSSIDEFKKEVRK